MIVNADGQDGVVFAFLHIFWTSLGKRHGLGSLALNLKRKLESGNSALRQILQRGPSQLCEACDYLRPMLARETIPL